MDSNVHPLILWEITRNLWIVLDQILKRFPIRTRIRVMHREQLNSTFVVFARKYIWRVYKGARDCSVSSILGFTFNF